MYIGASSQYRTYDAWVWQGLTLCLRHVLLATVLTSQPSERSVDCALNDGHQIDRSNYVEGAMKASRFKTTISGQPISSPGQRKLNRAGRPWHISWSTTSTQSFRAFKIMVTPSAFVETCFLPFRDVREALLWETAAISALGHRSTRQVGMILILGVYGGSGSDCERGNRMAAMLAVIGTGRIDKMCTSHPAPLPLVRSPMLAHQSLSKRSDSILSNVPLSITAK